MIETPSVHAPTNLLQFNPALSKKNLSTLEKHLLPLMLFPMVGKKEVPN